jgi:hypothetical protein
MQFKKLIGGLTMNENSKTNNDPAENKLKSFKNRRLAVSLFGLGALIGAVIIVFVIVDNRLSARTLETGDLIGGVSSCCSAETATNSQDLLAIASLEFYRENFGNTEGLEAVVEDYGCHQEITISRNGEALRRFSHSNGNFSDITP